MGAVIKCGPSVTIKCEIREDNNGDEIGSPNQCVFPKCIRMTCLRDECLLQLVELSREGALQVARAQRSGVWESQCP